MDLEEFATRLLGNPDLHRLVGAQIEVEQAKTLIELRKAQATQMKGIAGQIEEFGQKTCPKCGKKMRKAFHRYPITGCRYEISCDDCQWCEIF
jgi:hypothetical protein